MFRNSYQRGFFSIFFSAGSNPLSMWDTHLKDGYVARFLDPELKTMVFDICGYNISTAYMICPKHNKSLGIHLPFLVMIVKNLKKYFSFEVTIRDEDGYKRRFRVSNFQSTTKISITSTVMPIGLSDGWNQIQFNLSDFTRRAYGKNFMEVVSVKINANIRIRRIYFTDRLLPDNELPNEYRLFIPLSKKVNQPKALEGNKENVQHPSKVVSDVGIKNGIDKRLSEERPQRTESQQFQRQPLKGIENNTNEDQTTHGVQSLGSKTSSGLSPSTSRASKDKLENGSTQNVKLERLDEGDDDKYNEDTQLKEGEKETFNENQEEVIETNEDNVGGEDDVGTALVTSGSKDTQLVPEDVNTVYQDPNPEQEEQNA